MEENQQPGQIIIPRPTGESPKPTAGVMPAAQLPAPQPLSVPSSPAAVLPPVPVQSPVVPQPLPSQPQSPTPLNAPVVASSPEPTADQSVQNEPMQVEDGGWQFREEAGHVANGNHEPLPEGVTWTANQFLQHDKSAAWYGALGTGGILAVAGIYFLTKDKITTGIVLFALLAFGVYAGRKPRSEQYAVSAQGVQVGAKFYAFQDFKTFSVIDEGAAASIVFMPMKRFMPPITIYVPTDVEDRVVDFLSNLLPLSEHKVDVVDTLLRRIRF